MKKFIVSVAKTLVYAVVFVAYFIAVVVTTPVCIYYMLKYRAAIDRSIATLPLYFVQVLANDKSYAYHEDLPYKWYKKKSKYISELIADYRKSVNEGREDQWIEWHEARMDCYGEDY